MSLAGTWLCQSDPSGHCSAYLYGYLLPTRSGGTVHGMAFGSLSAKPWRAHAMHGTSPSAGNHIYLSPSMGRVG